MPTNHNLACGLFVVGGFAVFLGLMPGAHIEQGGVIDLAEMEHLRDHPEDQPWAEDYRLGWPDSPLIHYRSQQTLTAKDGGLHAERSFDWKIELLSWSALTLAIGIGLLWLGRQMRPFKVIRTPQPHIADD
jgi:hypothetical protein